MFSGPQLRQVHMGDLQRKTGERLVSLIDHPQKDTTMVKSTVFRQSQQWSFCSTIVTIVTIDDYSNYMSTSLNAAGGWCAERQGRNQEGQIGVGGPGRDGDADGSNGFLLQSQMQHQISSRLGLLVLNVGNTGDYCDNGMGVAGMMIWK